MSLIELERQIVRVRRAGRLSANKGWRMPVRCLWGVCCLPIVVLVTGCTTSWTESAHVMTIRVLTQTYSEARKARMEQGQWPKRVQDLRPLQSYMLKNGVAQLGSRYYRVVYSPRTASMRWSSLIALERVRDKEGRRFVFWREVYLVDEAGRVTLGQGWSADWIPYGIDLLLPVILFPLLLHSARVLRRRHSTPRTRPTT